MHSLVSFLLRFIHSQFFSRLSLPFLLSLSRIIPKNFWDGAHSHIKWNKLPKWCTFFIIHIHIYTLHGYFFYTCSHCVCVCACVPKTSYAKKRIIYISKQKNSFWNIAPAKIIWLYKSSKKEFFFLHYLFIIIFRIITSEFLYLSLGDIFAHNKTAPSKKCIFYQPFFSIICILFFIYLFLATSKNSLYFVLLLFSRKP